ncbi:hypothetical protein CRUP_024651 [Coryphaenoides rupestris]|nr:hypothetical protein CRUP_024651 [Coryphaenoides rupestris]
MENQTWSGDILLLEGLKVTPQFSIPAFILLFLVYIFIMVSNIGLTVLISVERSLHQPMYLLSCNLNVNDVLGATAILPRLLSDILTESAERYITYMGSVISNPFCDNASLFKLSCENVLINNIYGLGYTVVLLGSSLGSTMLTYLKIAMVCVTSKSRALNSRALQTCSTHLTVYLIMMISGFTFVALHRFPELSEQRKTNCWLHSRECNQRQDNGIRVPGGLLSWTAAGGGGSQRIN